MNIAFPAFFILILILPGFIFLSSYEKTENTTIERKPFDVSSSLAILIALILHTLLINLTSCIFNIQINYDICIKLLTGTKSLPTDDIAVITQNISLTTLYFIATYVVAYGLGKILQHFILSLNPYQDSLFAFDTPWYYQLKGKLSETKDAEIIKLSCLIETKNQTFLYYGILEDFYLDPNGQLDRVILSNIVRRSIENDDNQEDQASRFYEIKGDRMILKYSDIKNINIEYLYITEDE